MRPGISTSCLSFLVALAVVVSAGGLARAEPTVYDAAKDFSATDNPNGVWSYGVMAAGAPPDPDTFSSYSAGTTTWGNDIWKGNILDPNIMYNGTGSNTQYACITWTPGQMSFHPGAKGEYSTVRWTAPFAGTWDITSEFIGLDYSSYATSTDIYVLHNGVELFHGYVDGYKDICSFAAALTVAAGDTIDFSVGYGRNNWYGYDSTGLDIQVQAATPPVADAGSDQEVEATSAYGASVTLDGTGSYHPDGWDLTYEWSVPEGSGVVLDDATSPTPKGTFAIGPTLVTLTVTDGMGGVDFDDVLITVEDTTPPVVVCTTDLIALWPPDHKMRGVEIRLRVADTCTDPEGMDVTCTVESSEPDDGTGDGTSVGDVDGEDGYASPVAVALTYDSETGAFVGTVSLRAERDGSLTGRSYSIVCAVEDEAGNPSTASCVVVVPHDKRRR